MENAQRPKVSAVIISISDEVKTKMTKNGPGKDYVVCTVKFTEGKLADKIYFAQRTLGPDRAPLRVGQPVYCYASIVTDAEGKQRPFFDISASVIDKPEDILAGLL